MKTTSDARILVTGATGTNGTELVKLFAAQGIPVRAMVRDSKRAKEIALPTVEIVEGNFDTPETLKAALEGTERVFLLSNSSENAENQQLSFVRAAQKSGVAHIVKLSQLGAEANSPNRFLRYHAAVEAALRSSGMAYTFLRPNLFMQGLLNFRSTISSQNAFYAAAGEGQVSVVDIRDIADVAFAALTEPNHEGKTYDLTGPQALTHTEMAQQLSQAIGRTIAFVNVPPQAMQESLLKVGFPLWQAEGLLEEYAEWSQDKAAQVTPHIKEVTGKEPRDFATFARDYASEFK
ncbi:NAD(P)H azoreductase [Abditibacteriota bacterium]|nr:NAD(P)H azoreductase [Abditibacteriota bacterium]